MSIVGIAASSFFSGVIAHSSQRKFQPVRQEFQQLGQDIQTGNLAQAQADFTVLQKDFPGAAAAASGAAQNDSRPAGQGFQQLSHDLQSGNLAAARSDYANLRQDWHPGTEPAIHVRRHPRYGEDSTSSPNGIAQVLSQLGQALKSSNISAAQQSYATLLQQFQQSGAVSALDGGVAPAGGAVSFSA